MKEKESSTEYFARLFCTTAILCTGMICVAAVLIVSMWPK